MFRETAFGAPTTGKPRGSFAEALPSRGCSPAVLSALRHLLRPVSKCPFGHPDSRPFRPKPSLPGGGSLGSITGRNRRLLLEGARAVESPPPRDRGPAVVPFVRPKPPSGWIRSMTGSVPCGPTEAGPCGWWSGSDPVSLRFPVEPSGSTAVPVPSRPKPVRVVEMTFRSSQIPYRSGRSRSVAEPVPRCHPPEPKPRRASRRTGPSEPPLPGEPFWSFPAGSAEASPLGPPPEAEAPLEGLANYDADGGLVNSQGCLFFARQMEFSRVQQIACTATRNYIHVVFVTRLPYDRPR
jgi:hypothetical protein